MASAVQALLDSYEALSEVERHEAAVEILRRASTPAELTDEVLVAAADEVFCELDAQETNARIPARRNVSGGMLTSS